MRQCAQWLGTQNIPGTLAKRLSGQAQSDAGGWDTNNPCIQTFFRSAQLLMAKALSWNPVFGATLEEQHAYKSRSRIASSPVLDFLCPRLSKISSFNSEMFWFIWSCCCA